MLRPTPKIACWKHACMHALEEENSTHDMIPQFPGYCLIDVH